MTGAERFILIGCLLQGGLSREFSIWMPQSIEALSGSCVLIPCRFEIQSQYDKDLVAAAKGQWMKGGTHEDRTVFDSKNASSLIQGKITGDLLKKNCTTILEKFPLSYSDTYFFRLIAQDPLKYSFKRGVKINVQGSPPKPKLTPEKVEVTEGSSVSLNCSAAAPCPTLPPTLTWTPRLSDSGDQLQENHGQTKSVSSVLTFTASPLHHGQKITCTALYKVQQGDTQKKSKASLTLSVLFVPQISVSGSCSRTAAEISCSCESRGNPSPSMEWRVSGLRVTNSTDRVIREEQLGNTSLRSSLTMSHSQGDMPTLLCLSTNTLGNASLQLQVPSLGCDSGYFQPQLSKKSMLESCSSRLLRLGPPVRQPRQLLPLALSALQGQDTTSQPAIGCIFSAQPLWFLLTGMLVATSVTSILCGLVIKVFSQRKLKDPPASQVSINMTDQVQPSNETAEETGPMQADEERPTLPLTPLTVEEDSLHTNYARMTARPKEQGGTDTQEEACRQAKNTAESHTLHYASVKFSERRNDPEPPTSTQGNPKPSSNLRETHKSDSAEPDAVYAQVMVKKKKKRVKAEGKQQGEGEGAGPVSYLEEEQRVMGKSSKRIRSMAQEEMDSLYVEMRAGKVPQGKPKCGL